MRKLGTAALRKKVPRSRPEGRSTPALAHGEQQAKAWLNDGLKAAGLVLQNLESIKGSDDRKVLLADLLWRRTVVSQEWLARELQMKSAANVGQQIRRLDRKSALKRVPKSLRTFFAQIDKAS